MNTHKLLSTLSVAATLTAGGRALADDAPNAQPDRTTWQIDAGHTHVGFSVAHMVVSEVEGKFTKYTGKVQLDEQDPTRSQLEFVAEVSSIDTGNEERDKHLRSGDFFDAATFPRITFQSVSIKKAGKGYKILGDLTIRGVTQRVTLDATLSDTVTSPWGQPVRAARVTGSVDRRDFGLRWNKALDKGGVLIGDKVALDIKLELTK